jgi:hypothetical protein
MVGEYVLSNAHNSNLKPDFATSFCLSYFATQEATVAPEVFVENNIIRGEIAHSKTRDHTSM